MLFDRGKVRAGPKFEFAARLHEAGVNRKLQCAM